eukprot:TRINITY_DN6569_c0_g1_i1.p1 TRINITY_DN6569_c0_g1~~TRINITY_DN6569_c0_g1_i1.p1  ORF type:complete len:244 (-),score=50.17 TRINITY_DN6569_c0_g1_i1:104-769(-)
MDVVFTVGSSEEHLDTPLNDLIEMDESAKKGPNRGKMKTMGIPSQRPVRRNNVMRQQKQRRNDNFDKMRGIQITGPRTTPQNTNFTIIVNNPNPNPNPVSRGRGRGRPNVNRTPNDMNLKIVARGNSTFRRQIGGKPMPTQRRNFSNLRQSPTGGNGRRTVVQNNSPKFNNFRGGDKLTLDQRFSANFSRAINNNNNNNNNYNNNNNNNNNNNSQRKVLFQ